jgi:hypothetical protein
MVDVGMVAVACRNRELELFSREGQNTFFCRFGGGGGNNVLIMV